MNFEDQHPMDNLHQGAIVQGVAMMIAEVVVHQEADTRAEEAQAEEDVLHLWIGRLILILVVSLPLNIPFLLLFSLRNISNDFLVPRRPIQAAQDSPQEVAWDNPFPGFPGAKKKTSVTEEQRIVGQMARMDINGRPDDGRGPRSEHRGSPESMRRGQEGYGRPPANGGPPPPRGYPPQQGYPPGPGQRGPPGPAYGNGRGVPNGNGYGPAGGFDDGFGPPSRSMTMPTNADRGGNFDRPYPPLDVPGDSAPYNGPIGRPPPRPSTAGGQRPPPQRQYPPLDQEQDYSNGLPNANGNSQRPSHQNKESISDLYDHYFDEGT
jgi:hypothetical protein